jgi:hypothetical protein
LILDVTHDLHLRVELGKLLEHLWRLVGAPVIDHNQPQRADPGLPEDGRNAPPQTWHIVEYRKADYHFRLTLVRHTLTVRVG